MNKRRRWKFFVVVVAAKLKVNAKGYLFRK